MKKFLSFLRWFFTGLRRLLPFIPRFLGIAIGKMAVSTYEYWKGSQSVVDSIANDFMFAATDEETDLLEYDSYVYWACYSIASFLYLLGWLFQAWLTMEAFRLLVSVMP